MKHMLSRKNKRINLMLLVVIVILPCLVIAYYLFSAAQDRFVSTSMVVVKQVSEVSNSPTSGLGILLGTNNTSVEDARFLKEYIESPDMLNRLDQKLNFRQAFQGNKHDPIFQLSMKASKEELLKYYRYRVTVDLDEKTSLLSISTEGFAPDFALLLNQAILTESERFINEISQKVAREQLSAAEQQLKESSTRFSHAKDALLSYQNQTQSFDPVVNAEAVNKLVMNAQANLVELQTQERTLLSYLNPEAPQVVAIRSQMLAVQQQIASEQAKLTSINGSKLNRQAMQFETLKSEVEFGADLYKLSLTSLEKARLEAIRKMKNLVVISSPQQAQDSLFPRRINILLSALLLLTILYGFIRLTISVVRDHRE
jgi:capsular polysaccharide transport system permease protein